MTFSAPGNGSYKEWRRQNGEPKGIPTAAQIWELALKSGTEIAALTSKLHAVEKEKAALEKQLQEIERVWTFLIHYHVYLLKKNEKKTPGVY